MEEQCLNLQKRSEARCRSGRLYSRDKKITEHMRTVNNVREEELRGQVCPIQPSSTYYEGVSNENFKFVIKNRNFAPLSCKLVSVLKTACRMACRWQHSADA